MTPAVDAAHDRGDGKEPLVRVADRSPPEPGSALREAQPGHAGGDPGREGIGRETRGFPPDYVPHQKLAAITT